MSNFKDRLWRDLIREHGATLNEGAQPAKGARWVRPRLVFGGGLAGMAGVGTAVAIALGTAGTSPAFAVTQNHDGSYTVELWRASGIAGLNARLAQLRVPARAVAVHCYIGSEPPPSPGNEATSTFSQARIQVDQIPKGKWLELPATTSGGKGAPAANFVSKGASCDSPPPPCPPGPRTIAVGPNGTSTTTSGTSTTDTGTNTTGTGTSASASGGSGIAAQAPVTGPGTTTTGTGTTTTGTGTTTTGTGTTTAGGGNTVSLAGSPRQVPIGVLVAAHGCAAPWTSTAGPGTRTNWTGTSTSQTAASTAAAPATKAGSKSSSES